jgi:phosphoenolpyruvate-protein kinase (PTS system EI component)
VAAALASLTEPRKIASSRSCVATVPNTTSACATRQNAPVRAHYAKTSCDSGWGHLAALARERGIPAVLGVLDATRRIPESATVAVDGVAGVVRWMR